MSIEEYLVICLIIHKPADAEIPHDLIASALTNNPDGVGIMIAHDSGHVQVRKGLLKTPEQAIKLYEKHKHEELAMHFRLQTHGNITKDQCHPYQVLNRKEHGRDVWLMHNGILGSAPDIDTGKSDTWHMVKYIIRPALAANPDLLEEPTYISHLEDLIGGGNKFLILDGEANKYYFINKEAGLEHKGIWLSNRYALNRGTGTSYVPLAPKTSYYQRTTDWVGLGHGASGATRRRSRLPSERQDNERYADYWSRLNGSGVRGPHKVWSETLRGWCSQWEYDRGEEEAEKERKARLSGILPFKPGKGKGATDSESEKKTGEAGVKSFAEQSAEIGNRIAAAVDGAEAAVQLDAKDILDEAAREHMATLKEAEHAAGVATSHSDSRSVAAGDSIEYVGDHSVGVDPMQAGTVFALQDIVGWSETEIFNLVCSNPEGVTDLLCEFS